MRHEGKYFRHRAKRRPGLPLNLRSVVHPKIDRNMKTAFPYLILLAMLILVFSCATNTKTGVFVNGVEIPATYKKQLEQLYTMRMNPGRYWYDPMSGLWGLENGPAMGALRPSLTLGGPLSAGASNGHTGIFLNGRQIDTTELSQWQHLLGQIAPGRYWMDAMGNVGREGGPTLVNLLQIVQQYQANPYDRPNSRNVYGNAPGTGATFYRNWYNGTGGGASQDGFYIMGEDWSYSSF